MQPTESEKFRTLLSGVASFYRAEVSTFQLSIWWETLRSFDMPAVEDAFLRHLKNPDNGQFMPKPADIIKLIGGSNADSAQIAWTKVDRAVRHVGPYQTVIFDDPIIHAALADMGGWVELSRKEDDAWPFVQREFENRYRGYRNMPQLGAVPRLVGLFEFENTKNGHAVAEPVLLGDPHKAMQVMHRLSDAPRLTITHLSDALRDAAPIPKLPDRSAA